MHTLTSTTTTKRRRQQSVGDAYFDIDYNNYEKTFTVVHVDIDYDN